MVVHQTLVRVSHHYESTMVSICKFKKKDLSKIVGLECSLRNDQSGSLVHLCCRLHSVESTVRISNCESRPMNNIHWISSGYSQSKIGTSRSLFGRTNSVQQNVRCIVLTGTKKFELRLMEHWRSKCSQNRTSASSMDQWKIGTSQ